MHDEQAFIQAMHANPEDVSLRLVFADWLEERRDPRADLLRLMTTLTQSIDVPDRRQLEDRLRSLLASGVQPGGPFWTNSIGMKFALVPAGTFLMGSPADEEGRHANEKQHRVTLSKGFYLAVHPVTQACWRELMKSNPGFFQGDDLPVEHVSWEECQAFMDRLRERDPKPYRLPTAAEWEYACRAGTTTPFYFGDAISTDQANYDGTHPYRNGKKGVDRRETTPVCSFPANGWGLYDMHGNVWEWCADWHGDGSSKNRPQSDPKGPRTGTRRVLRGGSWGSAARYCRAADLYACVPASRESSVGLRVTFRLD